MKKTGKSPSERKDFAESVKAKRPSYFALLKMKGDSKKINTIIARAAKQLVIWDLPLLHHVVDGSLANIVAAGDLNPAHEWS